MHSKYRTIVATVTLLASVAMVGCFEGDLGHIVFATDLVVDGQDWDPRSGVVDGQVAQFAPHQGTDGEDLPRLDVSTTGGLQALWLDDQQLAVTGRGVRGRVRYDGAVRDHFRVRFAAPDHVSWVVHPALDPVEALAVLEGAEVALAPAIRDRRGRPLGYARDALEVLAEGTASAWTDPETGRIVVAGDQAGDAGLVLALSSEVLPTPDVRVVTADDVVEITTEEGCIREWLREDCEPISLGWTDDGRPVLGMGAALTQPQYEPPR